MQQSPTNAFFSHCCGLHAQTKDEDAVPLTINCWPSASGGESFVNIEYECRAAFDLRQLLIAIPCHQPPRITQARRRALFALRARASSTAAAGSSALPDLHMPVTSDMIPHLLCCDSTLNCLMLTQAPHILRLGVRKHRMGR